MFSAAAAAAAAVASIPAPKKWAESAPQGASKIAVREEEKKKRKVCHLRDVGT